MKKTIPALIFSLIGLSLPHLSQAAIAYSSDNFGTGNNQFTLSFTTIGNPGNAADPLTGYGAVGYQYRIGTYEVSQNQIDKATASGMAHVTAGAWSGNQPAADVSWYEAAAFANYLNTSTGHQAAYDLNYTDGGGWSMALWTAGTAGAGYDSNNQYRNSLAKYFLPSENEWYKAAYGLNDGNGFVLYPIGSNTPPLAVTGGIVTGTAVYGGSDIGLYSPSDIMNAGGLSSYGTMAQGGNIWETLETAKESSNNSNINSSRALRGGDYGDTGDPEWQLSTSSPSISAYTEQFNHGFRVASVVDTAPVPEPSQVAASLLLAAGIAGFVIVRRKKASALVA